MTTPPDPALPRLDQTLTHQLGIPVEVSPYVAPGTILIFPEAMRGAFLSGVPYDPEQHGTAVRILVHDRAALTVRQPTGWRTWPLRIGYALRRRWARSRRR